MLVLPSTVTISKNSVAQFIFSTDFSGKSRAAALRGLETPHGFQQPFMPPVVPHHDGNYKFIADNMKSNCFYNIQQNCIGTKSFKSWMKARETH